MPIIHCMSNSDVSEVDIRTGFAVSAFLFRFIDSASHEIKQVTATDEEQARDVLGGTLVFAARFRQDDNCRVTGGRDMSQVKTSKNDVVDLEQYNDICDQAYDVIKNIDTSRAKNHSQRRLLEFDALLTHIRCEAMPQIIQDSNVLFSVQSLLEQLHRPARLERSDTNNKVASNGQI